MSQESPNKSLEILKKQRPALLLAEVGAWLHMIGKYYEKFIKGDFNYATLLPDDLPANGSVLGDLLHGTWAGEIWKQLGIDELQAEGLSINNLIEGHEDQATTNGFVQLMQDAHGRGSGAEKGVFNKFATKQHGDIFFSTALGFELGEINTAELAHRRGALYSFLVEMLQEMQQAGHEDWPGLRKLFLVRIESDFRTSLAETRRPLNDVSLYDQTFASVAMFKASLAQNLLLGWQEPKASHLEEKYKWRLLRVGLDGPTFWGQAAGVNDILSRKGLIAPMLDAIKDFFEQDYPLGMEIYRDQNGSLFIVPEVEDLLEYESDNSRLRDRLQEIASNLLNSEFLVELTLSAPTRSMRMFGQVATSELPPPAPDPKDVQAWWHAPDQLHNREICSVCGLRPQGPGEKAIQRKVCNTCEERRTERSKNWLKSLDQNTIWLDEVADQTGRIALVVGKLGMKILAVW